MDTLIIGGPLTGKTVKNTGYQTKIGGQEYSLLTIDEIPVCYSPEHVSFLSALRELFWVYAKIPWSSGKLFIGGVLNGDKLKHDRPDIEVYHPKPFPSRVYEKTSVVKNNHKIDRYNLQRFIIDETAVLFYSLEGLSLFDIIQLLVKNYADKRN